MNPFGYGHGMPSYGYGGYPTLVAVLILVAVIAAIVVRLTFLSSRNEGRFAGFLGGLYDFWNFRTGILRGLLLALYLVFSFGQIAVSLVMIFSGAILPGLIMLVVAQLALRLFYEVAILFINLCYNVMDINRKLSPSDQKPSSAQPAQPEPPTQPEPPKPEF